MDALAAGAGLSQSLIEVFRGKKEYKTNLRFFRQCAIVWMARVIDCMFEDGDLSEDTSVLKIFSIMRDRIANDEAPSLHDMLKILREKSAQY